MNVWGFRVFDRHWILPRFVGPGSALAVALASGCIGPATPSGPAPSGNLPIKHVIFLVKENRTFDNYFGKFPGSDGATRAVLGHLRDFAAHDLRGSPSGDGIDEDNAPDLATGRRA